MAYGNALFSSVLSLFLLVLLTNLLMPLVPSVNSAHRPDKKHGKCAVYRPTESESGHRVKRLTGGTQGDILTMPWMVYLTVNYTYQLNGGTFNSKSSCTGSLVSRRHVLTAAHCAPTSRMPNSSYAMTLQFGSANKSTPGGVISVHTASFHVNPQAKQYFANYSDPATGQMGIYVYVHDTALIDLGQDLHLDETVQPVCVACLDNQTYPRGQAYIAGWGNIKPVCSGQSEWQDMYTYASVGIHRCITPPWADADKLCTQADSTHGIGGGDSGSPVLASANNGKSFLQVGVIGTTNCLSNQREDGASKIDKQWFEQITGVKCKKYRVNNNDGCEDEE